MVCWNTSNTNYWLCGNNQGNLLAFLYLGFHVCEMGVVTAPSWATIDLLGKGLAFLSPIGFAYCIIQNAYDSAHTDIPISTEHIFQQKLLWREYTTIQVPSQHRLQEGPKQPSIARKNKTLPLGFVPSVGSKVQPPHSEQQTARSEQTLAIQPAAYSKVTR